MTLLLQLVVAGTATGSVYALIALGIVLIYNASASSISRNAYWASNIGGISLRQVSTFKFGPATPLGDTCVELLNEAGWKREKMAIKS